MPGIQTQRSVAWRSPLMAGNDASFQAPPRSGGSVLLLIDHRGNRRQLADCLSEYYEVLEPEGRPLGALQFDAAVLDAGGFRLWRDELLDAKVRDEPTFLPAVLILGRSELNRGMDRSVWDNIDEFVTTPIDVLEFNERIGMLIRARTLALSQKDKLAYVATHDRATGLPNKHYFLEHLANAVSDASILDQKLYISVVHLSLARIMHSLGHYGLDRAASTCTARLKLAFEDSTLIARLTTEEWAVLHRPDTDMESLLESYRGLDTMFASPVTINEEAIHIAVRIGVGEYPRDASDAIGTLDCAMNALSQAKDSSPSFYSHEVQHRALRFIRTEAKLHEAVQQEQFELWFQPQLNLDDLRVTGVEALVRWRLPSGRIAPPNDFIAIAETTGLIEVIDRWVITNACRTMERWKEQGLFLENIAVNVSPVDIKAPDFAEHVKAVLERYHLPPSSLELELTESTLFDATDDALRRLNELRALGMNIAIDDFGTGYSSLSYIHRLPVTVLKIDQSFVKDIAKSETDEAIVKTIIWLARNFRLDTVAEGVETAEHAELLQKLGVTRVQGYYYARPMPEVEFLKWLGNRPE